MTSQQASPSKPPSSGAGGTGDEPRHCAECGTLPTPGQSFCDDCGAVLSWTSDRRDRGTSTAGPRSDASAPKPADPGPEADGAPGTDTGAAGADPAREPAREPSRADAPADAPQEDDTLRSIPLVPAAPEAEAADAGARARALLVPVADQSAPAPEHEIAPVLPGMPATARPRVQGPVGEPADENGPPCPWCEIGNRADRHFCRRCGMSLAERPGVAEARLPWWRRIRRAGDRPAPWAGERPKLRRRSSRVFSWIGYGLALGLVVYGAFHIDTAWNAARDHFAKRAQISPDSAAASRSFGGHPPKVLFDKISNSWWGPGVAQSAEGEWVEARFAEPVRLLDILITSGISDKASDLSEAALPHRMDAVITTADGKKTTRALKLDQMSGAQQRKFRAENVVSVRFVIRSAYNAGDKKQVSIAEIEFFTRATSGE
ncbi:NADase-type glycan-binding domain-containing protein [Streptomyces sp. BBFR102]|uniref:NADase-type glycan-binding domain-containing protein n=1 Tax=Streptomyces sp. BBFR102 TaxID=3448171 RepID=UPI003F52F97D